MPHLDRPATVKTLKNNHELLNDSIQELPQSSRRAQPSCSFIDVSMPRIWTFLGDDSANTPNDVLNRTLLNPGQCTANRSQSRTQRTCYNDGAIVGRNIQELTGILGSSMLFDCAILLDMHIWLSLEGTHSPRKGGQMEEPHLGRPPEVFEL